MASNRKDITIPNMAPVKRESKPKRPSLGHENLAPKAYCVVCSGEVVESMKENEGSTRHSRHVSGYNCSSCGLVYAFPPPRKGTR